MGICDNISSTTDSIKRNAPDPTSVKGLYWSSYDSIKRNAPDLTSVKGFYWSSYDYSRAAVTIIHNAVRVNTVNKLYPYWPDVETRWDIATNMAKKTATVAVREGAKLVPGGSTVYDIVLQSIPKEKKATDLKEFKDKVRQMETEQDRMKHEQDRMKHEQDRMKHELNDHKRLLEQHEMRRLIMELTTNKILGLNRKPEDVYRFFTKPEDAYRFLFTKPVLTGKQYSDDVIATGVKPE
ncbi:hypothetical protein LWI29_019431 [Acer saccharum]|uniref:Uncharacterized protein n=1 Tax=Acer saccharum TaxID=4024 RepID=A0AA39T519_ACESA|nr:hypothetical protein LWI29_019431 [Acer saccharum]